MLLARHVVAVFYRTLARLTLLFQSFCLSLVRLGPVPRHVAFIMDGNRRYARRRGLRTHLGHLAGSNNLEKTLEWCLDLGVEVVTVYAFSIENFKRPPSEVDLLMDIACKKFEEFAENKEFVARNGIRIRVLGQVDLLPPKVLRAARRAEAMTRNNTRATLNICCPYTSRQEMTEAVSLALRGVKEGHLFPEDINSNLLDRLMGTGDDPDLDVLVRTSGEKRLSDFMLWQATKDCHVHFLDVMWPDFNFWHMLPILFRYQATVARRNASSQTHPVIATSSLPIGSATELISSEVERSPSSNAMIEDSKPCRRIKYLDLLRDEKDSMLSSYR
ncbi:dehydrodolichyl diphosphate synthase [Phlyctochytrium arcticum]|nr:dehydrodolichyl diphosphate synthase [Phlyctochytrium arcticum]